MNNSTKPGGGQDQSWVRCRECGMAIDLPKDTLREISYGHAVSIACPKCHGMRSYKIGDAFAKPIK